MRCPACNFANPRGFAFCGRCGTSLRDEAGGRDSPPAGKVAAERRQLTVMFCDLESSTELAERLDPEELREVVSAYQAAGAAVIERFDGYVAQYLGDGLLVYFGYPTAHEDDAVRSVYAGLGIVDAIHELNERLERQLGVRLAVRLGIHTGTVVAGEVGAGDRRERLAMGAAPNVAARLQDLAPPDTVLVSASTQDLLRGFFHLRTLGKKTLKGIAEPLEVFRVLGRSGARTRFEAMASRCLAPMVGREAELEQIRECFDQARQGRLRAVLISAQAGIGKSRLIHRFSETLEPGSGRWFRCGCLPYFQNSALFPLTQFVEDAFGLEEADAVPNRLRKLEAGLERYRPESEEAVALLAGFLSLPAGERYPRLGLASQVRRYKTLSLLSDLVKVIAEDQPVVFILEDLHWVDPSTMEFLDLLLDSGRRSRLLVILSCRPSFEAPWNGQAHLTRLTLDRLAGKEIEEMARGVAGGKALPREVLRELAEKTDGVPLFVEELTKMLLESGMLAQKEGDYELVDARPDFAIPATLQDSLMARLDRLSGVKEITQLGSVLGREFELRLLEELSTLSPADLELSLGKLVEAEILYPKGRPGHLTYCFKHALIQEAAYGSLLKSTRQIYHGRAATILEERFPAVAERRPELLAHHFTASRRHGEAVTYWQRAGRLATDRSAWVEAAHHFEKGLKVLARLPESAERDRRELELQLALGSDLMATRGYAAREVEQAYFRARELCRVLGDAPQLFPVLYGLWAFHSVRSNGRACRELADKLLELSEGDRPRSLLARGLRGNTAFLEGDLTRALDLLEREAEFDASGHDARASAYGHDPELISLSYRTWCLTLAGFPDQALRLHQRVLGVVEREIKNPLALVSTLHFGIAVRYDRREPSAALQLAERSMEVSTEQGFTYWQALATMVRGWALARQGQAEEGISLLQAGMAGFRATGANSMRAHFLCYLADGFLAARKAAEGIEAIDATLRTTRDRVDRFYDAELYRFRGELLRLDGREDEAEEAFQSALATTRRQGARWLELRAAVSLGRLWSTRGRRDEARQLVAKVRARCREGAGTEDLCAADALLESLG